MIILEKDITPALYRLFNPGPDDLLDDETEFMSKQDVCYRRREGLWLHSWYGERDRLVHELATRLFA